MTDPLTRDGAWFVGLDAEGSLDRNWPYGGDGREGVEIVMGDSAKIVKVIPITTAREVVQAAEERAERFKDRIESMRDGLIRMSSYDAVAREYLRVDDEARGLR